MCHFYILKLTNFAQTFLFHDFFMDFIEISWYWKLVMNIYSIDYRCGDVGLKKSWWKIIDYRFSKLGHLLQDFVNNNYDKMRHQREGENQAQQGMILKKIIIVSFISLISQKNNILKMNNIVCKTKPLNIHAQNWVQNMI